MPSETVLNEFFKMFTGEELGGGMSRKVYQHPFDSSLVIKMEDSTHHFQNVIEWEIWQQFGHVKSVGKWLAPCVAISESGTFLIQKKALDLRPGEHPKRLPTWIGDHKLANFGMYEGRVVCRDYGLLTLGTNNKLRAWWGEKQ